MSEEFNKSFTESTDSTAMKGFGLKTIELNDQKAGMDGLDKEYINKIIYNASKGTPYFHYQEKRQERINKRVQEIKQHMETYSPQQKHIAKKKMDILAAKLEEERDLNHVIVHFDMDAFYAAVEIRDNPELQDKPIAVGSNYMLSTSNYIARKFGVRAAMPGFIAKKLCPKLIIVPLNFKKYAEVSHIVFNTLKSYDQNFLPMSLDEAYIDLTDYLCNHYELSSKSDITEWCWNDTEKAVSIGEKIDEIVTEIRQKIFKTTTLTASAGIAPNMMLAKICSDRNKPNGQFRISSNSQERKNFVSNLMIRKISGIGPVQEQIFSSLQIRTCQDVWENRDIISLLFSHASINFYLRVALGLGQTELKNDSQRKSKGVEETFSEISTPEDLYKKCHELALELSADLKASNIKGKVVVLKMKTVNFDICTRNFSLHFYTSDFETIYAAAKKLIDYEITSRYPHKLQLRLMGIRMTNLIEEGTDEKNKYQQTLVNSFSNLKKSNNQSDLTILCPICNQSQLVDDLNAFNSHLDECLQQNSEYHSNELQTVNCLDMSKSEGGQLIKTEIHSDSNFHYKNKKHESIDNNCNIDENSNAFNNKLFKNINHTTDMIKLEKEIDNINTNDSVITDVYSVPKNNLSNDSQIAIVDNCSDQDSFNTPNNMMVCPICGCHKNENLQQLNQHIDICLNRLTVRELLTQTYPETGEKRKQTSPTASQSAKKSKAVDQSCRKIDEYFFCSNRNDQ